MDSCHALAPINAKPLPVAIGDLLREAWLYAQSVVTLPARPTRYRCDARSRQPVLVLPGLTATDRTMRPMRFALRQQGYAAYGWGLGRNLGVTPDMLDRIDRRVRQLQRVRGERITLVGWSLGGLIAREYAKAAPDRVAAVVTLGSPFSGDISAIPVARIYRWIAGHPADAPPVPCDLARKPPVPTAAIWSRRDGVIPAAAARGAAAEADHRIEVACAHISYPSDRHAIAAVIDAIGRCRNSDL